MTSTWTDTLIERLKAAPHAYDFVQAVRLMEVRGWLGDLSPDPANSGERLARPGPGTSASAGTTVRFVCDTRLRYPHAMVTQVSEASAGDQLQLTVSGFGLLGAVGVLPYSYTTLVADTLHANNPALKAFIDMFQHRAVELFYGAASKYRIVINFERHLRGQPDCFAHTLASLTGIGLPELRNRLTLEDQTLLHFAGLFASKARTIAGLEALLGNTLNAPVRVIPLVGHWLPVDESEQTRIGGGRGDGSCGPHLPGQHSQLGSTALIGARVWSVQNNIRIVIGPISAARIIPLLPGGRDARMMTDIINIYCGLEFEFDVNLVIEAASAPRARLAAASEEATEISATRLGQTAWLMAGPSLTDRDDAVFRIDEDQADFRSDISV